MKSKKINSNKLQFFSLDCSNASSIPISNNNISAGFPSPADDFKETRISLDKTLVKNEEATFYARVSGKSMINAGLDDGDLLVVDRSLEPENGKIVVCFVDGEFTVKRLKKEKERLFLMPENETYKPIEITEANDLLVWGVVTYVIKAL
ncbi:LexA family protein [uncultured Croceitalea sp.]|uniref:LexA family protein n=1 Tax=uncultured Croceitalea sp. TaxID=1798908 RepID=UPI00374F2739